MTEQTSRQTLCRDDYEEDHYNCALDADEIVCGGTRASQFSPQSKVSGIKESKYREKPLQLFTGTLVIRGTREGKPGLILLKVIDNEVIKTQQIILTKDNLLNMEQTINKFGQ